jgi:hypothetical protein
VAERFSDRIGITTPRAAIQVGGMDEPLANSLWNVLASFGGSMRWASWSHFARFIATEHLRLVVDQVPLDKEARARNWLRMRFFTFSWWERYNLIEFVVQNAADLSWKEAEPAEAAAEFNRVLEREGAGYRFIGTNLVAISDEVQVAAIEHALATSAEVGFTGAKTHLDEALRKLAQKPEPDYPSAVTEGKAVRLLSM